MVKTTIIAGLLSAILGGEYNAKTLSIAEQDSILNDGISASLNEGMSNRYRLESENEQKIFRRSCTADWYIVDTKKNQRNPLGKDKGAVRDVTMSPNGKYIAFAKDNNLHIHKLDFGTQVAVTKDEDPDIINGIADWLYEEEFGTTALYAWSPDSKQLAFVRLDEHEVPSFSWDVYSDTQYPTADTLRYPKAGCNNAKATVCVYDVATKGIQRLAVSDEDCYIPRLLWTDANTLLALKINRDQTTMEVISCNTKSTVTHPIYKESSDRYYIDYSLFDEWKWLSDGRMIVLSEKDGWRRAYLYAGSEAACADSRRHGRDSGLCDGREHADALLPSRYYARDTRYLRRLHQTQWQKYQTERRRRNPFRALLQGHQTNDRLLPILRYAEHLYPV